MFSPRFRPLKGHGRKFGSCKLNRIYVVQKSIDECKYYQNISYSGLINEYKERYQMAWNSFFAVTG